MWSLENNLETPNIILWSINNLVYCISVDPIDLNNKNWRLWLVLVWTTHGSQVILFMAFLILNDKEGKRALCKYMYT